MRPASSPARPCGCATSTCCEPSRRNRARRDKGGSRAAGGQGLLDAPILADSQARVVAASVRQVTHCVSQGVTTWWLRSRVFSFRVCILRGQFRGHPTESAYRVLPRQLSPYFLRLLFAIVVSFENQLIFSARVPHRTPTPTRHAPRTRSTVVGAPASSDQRVRAVPCPTPPHPPRERTVGGGCRCPAAWPRSGLWGGWACRAPPSQGLAGRSRSRGAGGRSGHGGAKPEPRARQQPAQRTTAPAPRAACFGRARCRRDAGAARRPQPQGGSPWHKSMR